MMYSLFVGSAHNTNRELDSYDGKFQTFREAKEKGLKFIRDMRENECKGWMQILDGTQSEIFTKGIK